jgi:hypothetical protein
VTEIQKKIKTAQHPQRLRNTRPCFKSDIQILNNLPSQKLRTESLPEILSLVLGLGML